MGSRHYEFSGGCRGHHLLDDILTLETDFEFLQIVIRFGPVKRHFIDELGLRRAEARFLVEVREVTRPGLAFRGQTRRKDS